MKIPLGVSLIQIASPNFFVSRFSAVDECTYVLVLPFEIYGGRWSLGPAVKFRLEFFIGFQVRANRIQYIIQLIYVL